jgi:hypothetical protein
MYITKEIRWTCGKTEGTPLRKGRISIHWVANMFQVHLGWLPLHGNSPVNSALSFINFGLKTIIPVIACPPYPPDLAPCDFLLFPKLKIMWQQRRLNITIIHIKLHKTLAMYQTTLFMKHSDQWHVQWICCFSPQDTTLKKTQFINKY